MSSKDAWFNDYVSATAEDSVYNGWLTTAIPHVTSRTVYYDGNIAFTDGGDTVSTGNAKTIPNLYETLAGLNQRISDVSSSSSGAIDGIETTITGDDVTMKAVSGNVSHSLTIDADMISFKFTNGAEYSIQDIFEMLEELRARTFSIKTSVERADITETYINDKAEIVDPPGTTNSLWIKNIITA